MLHQSRIRVYVCSCNSSCAASNAVTPVFYSLAAMALLTTTTRAHDQRVSACNNQSTTTRTHTHLQILGAMDQIKPSLQQLNTTALLQHRLTQLVGQRKCLIASSSPIACLHIPSPLSPPDFVCFLMHLANTKSVGRSFACLSI